MMKSFVFVADFIDLCRGEGYIADALWMALQYKYDYSQKSEVRSQKSEVRSQKSEVRSQKIILIFL